MSTKSTPPTPNTEANCATGNTSACVYARLPQLPSGVKWASRVSTATQITGYASTVQPESKAFTTRRVEPTTKTQSNVMSSVTMITGTSGITLR